MNKIIFYGDTHGNNSDFFELAKNQEFNALIHLGDFGFEEDWEEFNKIVRLPNVFILPGNHDDYTTLKRLKREGNSRILGNYGLLDILGKKIFYVRGALSIDKDHRIPNISWWDDEEISFYEAEKAFGTFARWGKDIDIVISHAGPSRIAKIIVGQHNNNFFLPSLTESLLDEFLNSPFAFNWYFGHYHQSATLKLPSPSGKDRNLTCVGVNKYVEYTWED